MKLAEIEEEALALTARERALLAAKLLETLPPPGTDQLFEITLEPATGSPTGRPTGPVLFKGNTSLAL